jgi:prepilin-type N-terminal cleavage/methylation domain-containing protein
MSAKPIKQVRNCNGFTLIEALLSVALLALVASAITAPFISGFQSQEGQNEDMLLDSMLRSRMEELLSRDFSALSSGQETVTVKGENYTIEWNVLPVDLDADTISEPNVWKLRVKVKELEDLHSLKTIIVDNQGGIGKVS